MEQVADMVYCRHTVSNQIVQRDDDCHAYSSPALWPVSKPSKLLLASSEPSAPSIDTLGPSADRRQSPSSNAAIMSLLVLHSAMDAG